MANGNIEDSAPARRKPTGYIEDLNQIVATPPECQTIGATGVAGPIERKIAARLIGMLGLGQSRLR